MVVTSLFAARPVARFHAAPIMQANEPGMRMRPLGSSGIMVSEMGLGTQRWGGSGSVCGYQSFEALGFNVSSRRG